MKRKLSVIIAFLTVLTSLFSCQDDFMPQQEESVVVEGWIDAGGFPIVILTRSLPLRLRDDAIPLEQLQDYVIRWAKVTLSDGDTTVVLTGGKDNDYFPPFIYTTGQMRGMSGKTYTLKVETDGQILTAVTTIPDNPPIIDSIVCRSIPGDTAVSGIDVYIRNRTDCHCYYKSFYMDDIESGQFISSYLGVVDGYVADTTFVMQIMRGTTVQELEMTGFYFPNGSDVVIKVATMDSVSFSIWQGYEDKTRLGYSYVTSSTRNIPTNINGGIGYWCGYNAVNTKRTVCFVFENN